MTRGEDIHHSDIPSILPVRTPSSLSVRSRRDSSRGVGSELLNTCSLDSGSREGGEDGTSCDGGHGCGSGGGVESWVVLKSDLKLSRKLEGVVGCLDRRYLLASRREGRVLRMR